MMYDFVEINDGHRNQISHWSYGGGYMCFDMEKNYADLYDLINTEKYEGFVAVNDDDEIIGVLECYIDEDCIQIANALAPEFIGKGLGLDFINNCIDFIVESYEYARENIVIYLRPNNSKAMNLYERAGFIDVDESEEWIKMELSI